MRAAFIDELILLAAKDPRVVLLTGDLGWGVVEPFAEAHPARFFNVGVAEANMAGVAAGLAQEGFVPFIYSIATFSSMRCYEQVRNGAVLQGLPVRVVGIGGGYAYGHAGPTHHAVEDLAIARAQPGLTVIVPADPAQTRSVLRALADVPGPAYLRIGKGGNAEVPGLRGRYAPGRPEIVREGDQVLLLGTGSVVHEALRAADILLEHGVRASVAVLAHLGFEASEELALLLARFPAMVTVEEGYVSGGLGSLVGEAVAERGSSLSTASLRCPSGPGGARGQRGLPARARPGWTGPRSRTSPAVAVRSDDGAAPPLPRAALPESGRPHREGPARLPARPGRGGLSFELVVVPNACTDRTAEIARRLAAGTRASGSRRRAAPAGATPCSTGLGVARGSLLAYANSARTDPLWIPPLRRASRPERSLPGQGATPAVAGRPCGKRDPGSTISRRACCSECGPGT